MNSHFFLNTDTYYGANITSELAKHLKALSFRRLGIIMDSGLSHNSYWSQLLKSLEQSFEVALIHSNSVSEPDYDYLDHAKADFIKKKNRLSYCCGWGKHNRSWKSNISFDYQSGARDSISGV